MGNLIQGVVTPNILADVFNAILKKVAPKLCEREVAGNPVVNVIMDSQGSFGFVELRCFEMAQIALRFDKVDVCGRPMNVGRPKGYIEDPRVGDDCPQEVVDSMVEFGGSLDDDEAKAKEKAKKLRAELQSAKQQTADKKKCMYKKSINGKCPPGWEVNDAGCCDPVESAADRKAAQRKMMLQMGKQMVKEELTTVMAKTLMKRGGKFMAKLVMKFGAKMAGKLAAKLAVRIVAKVAVKMAAMAAKMAAYGAAGPVGALMMLFDLLSMAVDIMDLGGYATFLSLIHI